jgi:branched-chain amino acid transport system ATP-binding protein
MSAEGTVLEMRGIAKQFAGFKAVNGVSLSLREGEKRALIGPNGAGKTTLFHLLSGGLRADSGEILYRGRPIQGLPAHAICRLGLARTFQITSIFAQLSPLRNVQVALFARDGRSYQLIQRAADTDAAEAARLLDDVGLGRAREGPSGLLSYGDQKRLELAIALAMRPRLLLLDEPTAGMESTARREIVALITRLCQAHALTLLFCEHDMDSVFSIADRITVLHQGRVLTEGTPEEVRNNEEVRSLYLGTAAAAGGRQ